MTLGIESQACFLYNEEKFHLMMSSQEWALLCPAEIRMPLNSGQYKEGFVERIHKKSLRNQAQSSIDGSEGILGKWKMRFYCN